MNENVNDKINKLIENNDVCLFMKGTPEVPQCGFSLAVSNVLKHLDVNFKGINVLEDNEIREGIKKSLFNTIVTLDGDGQNNPKDITLLLNKYFSFFCPLLILLKKLYHLL